MSIIADVGVKFENLYTVLQTYRTQFANIESDLKLRGVSLDVALVNHGSSVGFYQIKKAELRALRKYTQTRIDQIKAKLWKYYTEHHSRELNYRDKEQYVNLDQELIEHITYFHDISELEDMYEAAGEALQQRGFMLNAIVKARVAGFDSIIL